MSTFQKGGGARKVLPCLKVRQHLSGAVSRNSRLFCNINYGICNIYFKFISLGSQIRTSENKKYIFDNYSLREHILPNFQ